MPFKSEDMAKRYTKEEKEQILSAFRQRREVASQFSRRTGVSLGSLYRWQQESGLGFLEVVADIEPSVSRGLRVVMGDTALHFDVLPPVGYVAELLQLLRTC